MKPSRILMTTDAVGGVWNYSVRLAGALAARGIHVDLAVMGPPPKPCQRVEAEKLPHVHLHVADFRLEWMPDPWDDLARAGDWLQKIGRDADLVHLNGYVHADLPWEVPVCVVAHSCVSSWWEAVHRRPAPDEWMRYRDAVASGLRAADHVIVPTRAMKDALERHYGPLGAWSVIYHGIDQSLFRPGIKEEVIFAAGRIWDPAKNLQSLGVAAPDLRWPVVVAGEGDLGDEGGFQSLGRVSECEVAARMARAAIYCLPARYEPFGLSILEAARSGCALVIGDIPSLRELWDGAAMFVDPESRRDLVEKLRALSEDGTMRECLARMATARSRRLTLERMADGTLETYGQMLRRSRNLQPRELAA